MSGAKRAKSMGSAQSAPYLLVKVYVWLQKPHPHPNLPPEREGAGLSPQQDCGESQAHNQ